MSGDTDEIILEIEGIPLTCNRQQLTRNSDYFKAMLEGNFLERRKKAIKIEGVDFRAMNIILKLLNDDDYFINEEDILEVLHAACMLQFLKIRDICIRRLTELLTPANCLRIWMVCEQLDIKPLSAQAKTMSLAEFSIVKDQDFLLDLTLSQLCKYLGNTNLQCENEIEVFQTAMKWWYENSSNFEENTREILLKLISCLDFNSITLDEIKDITVYPDLSNHQELLEVLQCVTVKKRNGDISGFSDSVMQTSEYLLSSRSRCYPEHPCFLVEEIKCSASRVVNAEASNNENGKN